MAEKKNKIEIVIGAIDSGLQAVLGRVNKSMAAAGNASKSYGQSMSALQAPVRAITGGLAQLGAAFGAVFATQKFLQVAEQYSNIDARLRLVTKSSEELAAAQSGLYDISQKTGTGYQENADTYYRLAVAMGEAGASGSELLKINEAVSKSLIVNGSSVEQTSSFLLQFGQAMGSGVLQGDEFRAMMESNSYFAKQLAKALNTDVAGLKKMSSQGQLTTAAIRESVPKMLEQINADFAKMPLTIGRAMTMMSNAFGKIVNGSNAAGGSTGKIATAIKEFVTYLDKNSKNIEDFVVKMLDFAGAMAKAAWEYKGFIAGFAATSIAISALASLTTAVKGLSAAFVVIGGANILIASVVGAAVLAGAAIGRLIAQYVSLRKATEELKQAQIDAKSQEDWISPKIAARLNEINTALNTNYKTMGEVIAAEKRGEISFDSMTQTWVMGSKEQAAAVKSSAEAQKNVSGEALEAMKAKYRAYAEEVKRLQDEIAGREKSLYEQLRDMARSGMSGLNAWTDMKQEAKEYETVAKAAAEAGDFKTAVEYADKARDLYSQLNTEVKEGDRVLVSQADALKTAMDGVKSAGTIAIEALKKQQEAADGAMNALTEKSGFQNLREGMTETETSWLNSWDNMKSQAINDIEKVEERLRAIKDKNVTVWINEKVKKANGGPVGFARGGRLPGFGGGDRISALLEAGEFVIRKEAVAKFGAGLFSRLNSLQLPDFSKYVRRFATGGPVSPAMAAAGAGPSPINITLNYSGGGSQADANRIADMVMGALQRKYRRASA